MSDDELAIAAKELEDALRDGALKGGPNLMHRAPGGSGSKSPRRNQGGGYAQNFKSKRRREALMARRAAEKPDVG